MKKHKVYGSIRVMGRNEVMCSYITVKYAY